MLRKSLSGGYHFARIAVGAGQERFKDVPKKNEHSHVGDAYGYLMVGGGEYRTLTRKNTSFTNKTFVAQSLTNADFDVFA